ncbi:MAG: arylsulfatase A [Cyclobacteriaceae bacterium]|jgi:arylsulfatase A
MTKLISTMRVLNYFILIFILAFFGCSPGNQASKPNHPNIIVFYVDDLGYGDLSSYGADQIATPNVDKLAANGLLLTDAHSTAATCTPSRYSLLTGEYAFRNNAAILPGDAPLLIPTDKPTLPKMLRKAGYKTAVVGKWHLGLGNGNINWNGDVKPGPLEIGFDYSFLLPSTGDRVPSVYLENHRVVNLEVGDSLSVSYKKKIGNRPTGTENPDLLRYGADLQHSNSIVNGISRIGFMQGGQSAEWVDEDFPNNFVEKSRQFITESKDNPFFLFFSFHDIHVPRLPMDQFRGKSSLGLRGDAILQMDWTVGEVMKILKEQGIEENTLVIFTSDNGPVINDGYEDGAVESLGTHDPSGGFSGGKYSALEAGTRVPTIINWPAKVGQSKSDALFSQVDVYSSLATILNVNLESNEAIDSQDLSQLITGNVPKGREIMLEESSTLSLRNGNWKYIRPFNGDSKWIEGTKKIASGLSKDPQLYDLADDPTEQNNMAVSNPEKVQQMDDLISSIQQRSTRD